MIAVKGILQHIQSNFIKKLFLRGLLGKKRIIIMNHTYPTYEMMSVEHLAKKESRMYLMSVDIGTWEASIEDESSLFCHLIF